MTILISRKSQESQMKFSKTQQRIVDLLSDGSRHSVNDIIGVMEDELTSIQTIRVHIHHIRKILARHGQTILVEWYERKRYYRWVRLLGNPYNGD